MALTIQDAAVRAAVTVAARFSLTAKDPTVLADGANIVVHLRPAPVVAKVAASTPAVRADNQDWLQRELDVSAFLTAEGAPVVPPSPELPATTHRADGHVMSFWTYLPPAEPKSRPDEETIGSMLRDLHAALRRYPKTQQYLTPLQDIPAYLARPQARMSQSGKAALAAAYQRLTEEVGPAAPQQALHGDAGGGNLMATDRGWVWHDFEDTCSGPVTWDLAAYRHVKTLDVLFLVQTATCLLAGLVTRHVLVVLGAAPLMAGTFLLARSVGIFGFRLTFTTTEAYTVLVVESAAVVLLLLTAALQLKHR